MNRFLINILILVGIAVIPVEGEDIVVGVASLDSYFKRLCTPIFVDSWRI